MYGPKKRRVFSTSLILLLVSLTSLFADVSLPRIFGDHMVLQREKPINVWGWDAPGTDVTVTFNGQSKSAKAGADGKWTLALDALKADKEGKSLIVKGSSQKEFKNVLVGEVWICSGQSNMEWNVGNSMQPDVERKNANLPLIRHFNVSHVNEKRKKTDLPGNWTVCQPNTVNGFTAVGFFFARKISAELDIPVGLIGTNWGGTRVEPWTAPEGFRMVPELKSLSKTVDSWDSTSEAGHVAWTKYVERVKAWNVEATKALAAKKAVPELPKAPEPDDHHQTATKLYNGMIHPLIPYSIRGALWYQGESNGGEGITYFYKKKALIEGWRKLWGQGDFPFYFVQLANFQNPHDNPQGGDGWAKHREGQRKCLELKNTGMAVIIDIGEAHDIHPRNKQDVGLRLAYWALAKDYGKSLVYSGPLYKSHKVEGSAIRVEFDSAGSGLMVGKKNGLAPTVEDSSPLKRFAIAGADKKWHWADVKIDGNSVVVSSDKVKAPVAVRYAYMMNPTGCNLYNKEGLPASPFRTDSW
ncbi:MAG: 9-O-acetylesterase [Lentisphaeraceae bacterium]|nr:9-O-acetylesterase [Lentisphaeraceae bacterium]